MKKVFVANKSSYGAEFYDICDSLQALKNAITDHHFYRYDDEEYIPDYSDKRFEEARSEGSYSLYEVDLHPDEEIVFSEYDGASSFSIEKIDKSRLSTMKKIKEEE